MKLKLNQKILFGGVMYRGGDDIPDDLAKKMGITEPVKVDWENDVKPKDKKPKKKEGE